MGTLSPRSVSLATLFGAASSSCSFAALAAARSLVLKGAHFVAAATFDHPLATPGAGAPRSSPPTEREESFMLG